MKLRSANKVYYGQIDFRDYRNGTITKAIGRIKKALATKRRKAKLEIRGYEFMHRLKQFLDRARTKN
jgi:hypothetical protein